MFNLTPRVRLLLVTCLIICLTPLTHAADAPAAPARPAPVPLQPFAIHDNDVWVIVGDSITWQNLYTVYLEAFIRARYPKLRFVTVNSGKSGEVYIQGIIRFRDTIAAYQPTLVTVGFGMNDHTKTFPGEQNFLDVPASSPQRLVDLVKKTNARLIIISAPPMQAPANYATDGGKFQLTGDNADAKNVPPSWRSNPVNRMFADRLAQLAARNNAPFIDQMQPLQAIWEANYSRDRVAAFRRAIAAEISKPITPENFAVQSVALTKAVAPFLANPPVIASMGEFPDREQLLSRWRAAVGSKAPQLEEFRVYLNDWSRRIDAAHPPFVQVSGYTDSQRPTDLIHPNEAGHLHMAGVLFKLLGADGLVSDVTIDAAKNVLVSAEKAAVRELSVQSGVITFKRLDDSLPLPIDVKAEPALQLDVPTSIGSPRDLFGMSRHLLTITNLPAGEYDIAVDGQVIATVSAADLAKGFDAGLIRTGPIAQQTTQLLAAVRAGMIRAIDDQNKPVPAPAPDANPAKPRVYEQAQPIERTWTIRRRSN